MNHREADDKNIAELYQNQELTAEEELAFEEHLLSCHICRSRVQMLKEIREEIEFSEQQRFREVKNKPAEKDTPGKHRVYFLRIAAVIILIISISVLTTILVNERKANRAIPAAAENSSDKFPKTQIDSQLLPDIRNPEVAEGKIRGTEFLAINFKPDVFYEKLVEEDYRNPGLTILNPLSDTLTQLPVFKWEESEPETVILKIIDNREKIVFEGYLKNGTIPDISVRPGLYYWQLQGEKETLYTGKFTYIPFNGR
jgi:hypothetical protein